MKTVSQARYILALASNTVTDEVRQAYMTDLESNELDITFFGSLLSTVTKMFSNKICTSTEANNIIQTEYNAFQLSDIMGDYSQYQPLIETVFQEIGNGSDKLVRCKRLIAAVDDVQFIEIKYGVYLAVLNYLVNFHMILDDVPFSEAVTAFVDSNNSENEVNSDDFRTSVELALIAPSVNVIEN